MRKRTAFLLASTVALIATPATAQETPAVDGGVTDTGTGDAVVSIMTEKTPAITPGQDSWIVVPWTAEFAEARQVQVTATAGPGAAEGAVEVGYPANTGTFSSLYRDDTLSEYELDYTALRIRVDPAATGPHQLLVTISYVSDTGAHEQTFELPITIDDSEFVGQGLALDDSELATLGSSDDAWLDQNMEGLEDIANVELRVIDAGPFDVAYPAERDHARPARSSDLRSGDQDSAAIRFTSDETEPGTYTIIIEASYYVGSSRLTMQVERTIVIEEADGGDGGGDGGGEATGVLYDSTAQLGQWTIDPYGKDTATTGVWSIGVPQKTSWSGHTMQPEGTPSGTPALVTDPRSSTSAGDYDIDGGKTSALSPLISLPQDASIELGFSYFFGHLFNATSQDYLRVSIVGEDGSTKILNLKASKTNHAATWTAFDADLSDFAGQDVQILLEAADAKVGSLVEAGVGDIIIRTN